MNEKFQKVTFDELKYLKTVLSFSTRYKIKSISIYPGYNKTKHK